MDVLCACDNRYLPHAATMLCSLLEHNIVKRVHFFYNAVTDSELLKLKSFALGYGCDIFCYQINPNDFQDLRVDKWASTAVYYRLLASRLLPADLKKVLYLDSDIIVRGRLGELWGTDLTGYALAAVPDYWQHPQSLEVLPKGKKLFNSGVLLINLKYWRTHNVPEQAIAFVKDNPEKVQFWDQEALNAILVSQWIELPVGWNAQGEKHWAHASVGTKTGPAIVHFINSEKPWHWSSDHAFKAEYHKYRRKTPWSQYQQDGRPPLPQRLRRSVRRFLRMMLPRPLRRWLRLRIMNS